MFDRILVPTDGSPAVEPALDRAIELARIHDGRLQLLYVVNVIGYGSLPMETAWEGISDALHEDGRRAVERAAERVPEEVPVETVVREGSPSRTIVEQATPDRCDLVVMGTHGRGGIDRLLLGSVTERVVRHAAVPVLTVQADTDAFETATGDARVPVE